MKRLVLYLICVAFAFLLATPALASATTSTADQIAQLQKAVAALQTLSAQQGQQIQALQAQVAAKHTILSGIVAPAVSLGCVGDLYVNTATYQIYGPKTCGGWGNPTSLVGPKGATGATGATGAMGPIGPQGVKGATGAQGPKGDAGATGAVGPVGPQGAKGDTGATGAKGDVGPVGAQGANGDKGAPGLDGKDGAPGVKGDKGDPGLDGKDGAQGPIGPAGPMGEKGDIGLAGSDGKDGAQGPVGPAGPKGDTGLQGPKGDKGDKGDTGPAGATDPKWTALAPFVQVVGDTINGNAGPNVVFSGANFFTQTDSGIYALLGLPHYDRPPVGPASVSTTGLHVVGQKGTQHWQTTIDWTAPASDDVAHYCVYRREVANGNTGAWTLLTTTGPTTTTWQDDTPAAGSTYEYGVSWTGGPIESAKTTTSSTITIPVVDHLEFDPPAAAWPDYSKLTEDIWGNASFTVRAVDQQGQTVTQYDGRIDVTAYVMGESQHDWMFFPGHPDAGECVCQLTSNPNMGVTGFLVVAGAGTICPSAEGQYALWPPQ